MADIHVGKVWGKSRAGIADLLGMGYSGRMSNLLFFFIIIINKSVGSSLPGEILKPGSELNYSDFLLTNLWPTVEWIRSRPWTFGSGGFRRAGRLMRVLGHP